MARKTHIVPIDEPPQARSDDPQLLTKAYVEANRTLHAWLGVPRSAHQSPTWDDARVELQQVIDQHDMNVKFYGRATYEQMQRHFWRREIDQLKADLKRGVK